MRNPWKVSTLFLSLLLVVIMSTSAIRSSDAGKEPQPLMKSGLRHLKLARTALEKATHDKGGHRVAAIKLTNEAIEQVEKGIAFDNAK